MLDTVLDTDAPLREFWASIDTERLRRSHPSYRRGMGQPCRTLSPRVWTASLPLDVPTVFKPQPACPPTEHACGLSRLHMHVVRYCMSDFSKARRETHSSSSFQSRDGIE